jgi:hypothetical protein
MNAVIGDPHHQFTKFTGILKLFFFEKKLNIILRNRRHFKSLFAKLFAVCIFVAIILFLFPICRRPTQQVFLFSCTAKKIKNRNSKSTSKTLKCLFGWMSRRADGFPCGQQEQSCSS